MTFGRYHAEDSPGETPRLIVKPARPYPGPNR